MSIKSVLKRQLVVFAEHYKQWVVGNIITKEDLDKDLEGSTSAILAEFEKMLPEERHRQFCYGEFFSYEDTGYNQCLSDIKARLEGE